MLERIKAFTASKLGIRPEKLTGETTIETGVQIAGLDTLEFYQDFFLEFEIENPEDFNVDKYVSPEGIDIIGAIRAIFSRKFREAHSIKEVSLKHLSYVAEQKRWFDPS